MKNEKKSFQAGLRQAGEKCILFTPWYNNQQVHYLEYLTPKLESMLQQQYL